MYTGDRTIRTIPLLVRGLYSTRSLENIYTNDVFSVLLGIMGRNLPGHGSIDERY